MSPRGPLPFPGSRTGRTRYGSRGNPDAPRAEQGCELSPWAAEPYVVVAATIALAGSAEEARRILVPEAWSMAHSRTHGVFPPLAPAERIEARTMTEKERRF